MQKDHIFQLVFTLLQEVLLKLFKILILLTYDILKLKDREEDFDVDRVGETATLTINLFG